MIAIDTNLLIRHLTQDDRVQANKVAQLFKKNAKTNQRVLLTDIVLCETAWVLTRFYRVKRLDLISALEALAADSQFVLQNPSETQRALQACRSKKGHFADHLIAASAQTAGCSTTYTFEKGLRKTDGFTVL